MQRRVNQQLRSHQDAPGKMTQPPHSNKGILSALTYQADEVAAGREGKYTNGKDTAGVLEVAGMHSATELVERDGREDEICGDEVAGVKQGVDLAVRGIGVLIEEYLVGAEECDEGEEVDTWSGSVGGVGSDGWGEGKDAKWRLKMKGGGRRWVCFS
ncbi:uncharacterized protein MONOS_13873 [Monocercomonoides exilis]|uniref:uncharacterized protein n=1 Tax=Monocercomonoides exilis TaxID=2049356 RepID=UPI00355AA6A3|nr:hypothetical protein MONOS_13873 [Monocercomonoides exilis]|eukprot:MONOS_13873.1-p1 / transcript=MONOS_13873.1 / gene=MONOS_13873 / organism=Monocercomonoides_exilis_PA203 / gene_product=unspecified product / transcript_product=unspecified product / location=Mono_scaffold00897:9614-10505(+) / protein_length=157 / sequence_SO=supercontig / SO=protein_coding / is_pseudo=false